MYRSASAQGVFNGKFQDSHLPGRVPIKTLRVLIQRTKLGGSNGSASMGTFAIPLVTHLPTFNLDNDPYTVYSMEMADVTWYS